MLWKLGHITKSCAVQFWSLCEMQAEKSSLRELQPAQSTLRELQPAQSTLRKCPAQDSANVLMSDQLSPRLIMVSQSTYRPNSSKINSDVLDCL